MSFINFLRHGAQMNDAAYDRFNEQLYIQDNSTLAPDAIGGSYAGQNTQEFSVEENLETGTLANLTRIIDGVLTVVSVPDSIRNDNTAFWKSKKMKALTFTVFASFSAAATALATAGVVPAFIGITLVIVEISLAILSMRRAKQAEAQIQAWKDPFVDYQNKRKRIELEGVNAFPYLLKSNQLNIIVNDSERKSLWSTWANDFFVKYTNGSIKEETITEQQIAQFFNLNPFDQTTLDLPQDEYLIELSNVFNKIKGIYRENKIDNKEKKDKLLLKKNSLIQENERAREKSKAPVNSTLQHFKDGNNHNLNISKLEKEYNNKKTEIINDYNQTDKKNPNIRKACDVIKETKLKEIEEKYLPAISESKRMNQKVIAELNTFYQQVITPIDLIFDEKAKKINEFFQQQINTVEANKNQQTFKFSKFMIDFSTAFINKTALIPNQDEDTSLIIEYPQEEINLNELYNIQQENLSELDFYSQEAYINFFDYLQNQVQK